MDGTPALQYPLNAPVAVAVDAAGNVYVAERIQTFQNPFGQEFCGIVKLDVGTNTVSRVAGAPPGPHACGFAGDGGPATDARLGRIAAMAVDAAGHLFVADSDNYRIRRIDASTGQIVTVAGDGGSTPYSGNPSEALRTSLLGLVDGGMAFDSQGSLVFSQYYLWRLAPSPTDGLIKGRVGEGELISPILHCDLSPFPPCPRTPFGGDGLPAGQANGLWAGSLIVASDGSIVTIQGLRVRQALAGSDGVVTGDDNGEIVRTIAGYEYDATSTVFGGTGTGGSGFFNGDAFSTNSSLAYPQGVLEDPRGGFLILDSNNRRVRHVGVPPAASSAVLTANAGPDQTVAATTTSGGQVNLDGSATTDTDASAVLTYTWTGPFGTLTGVTVTATLPLGPSTITLTATDNHGNRSTDTVLVTVSQGADLSVVASATPNPVESGSPLTIEGSVSNRGPFEADAVILTLPLTTGEEYVSADAGLGSCQGPAAGSAGNVTCNLGRLTPTAVVPFHIVIKPKAAGPFTSIVSVASSPGDPNPSDNTATLTATVTLGPVIVNVTETILVSDSVVPLPSAMVFASETITVSDSVVPLPSAMVFASENITVSDSVVPLPSAMVFASENITVSDSVVPLPSAMVFASESITVSDGVGVSAAGMVDTAPPVLTAGIVDTAPPVLALPAAFEVVAESANGAIVSYAVTAVDDHDPNPVVRCVPPSGSLLPVGQTMVQCTATDASGNTAAGAFAVTVRPKTVQLQIAVELPSPLRSRATLRVVAEYYSAAAGVAGPLPAAVPACDNRASCTWTPAAGSIVLLRASSLTPLTGPFFTGWTGCDALSSGDCYVTMNDSRTLGARFSATRPTYEFQILGTGTFPSPGGDGRLTATAARTSDGGILAGRVSISLPQAQYACGALVGVTRVGSRVSVATALGSRTLRTPGAPAEPGYRCQVEIEDATSSRGRDRYSVQVIAPDGTTEFSGVGDTFGLGFNTLFSVPVIF